MKIESVALQTALHPHRIRLLSHLSTRPFTECFLGVHDDTGARVFIKVLGSEESTIRRNFLRELEILKALQGQPGFPVLVAVCPDCPTPFHACECLSMPSLADTFGPSKSPSLHDVLQSTGALAHWICDLHQRGYVHRDLSPDHVFAADGFPPIVVDFGMAKCTNGMPRHEARLYEGYDVQAFGLILWELICGRPALAYRSDRLAARIPDEIALIQSVGLPTQVGRLIVSCLSARSEFTPDGLPAHDPFESADALRAAMRALMESGPGHGPP